MTITKVICLSVALVASELLAEDVPSAGTAASTNAPSVLQIQASRFAGMYFAPMCGLGFYRLRDPLVGIVEFRQHESGEFFGAGGWSAVVKGKGEAIGIRPPAGDPGADFEFIFAAGEPVKFIYGGTEYKIKVEDGDTVCHGEMPVMWDEAGSDDHNLLKRKWPGRFTVFYTNPNRTAVLFASVTLAFFTLFLYASRRWLVGVGAFGAVAGAVLTALPLSRAALLALAIGGLLLVIGRFFRAGGRKRIWLSVALAAAVGIGFVCKGGYDRLSFGQNRGDSLREVVWHEVPGMMNSAPRGLTGMIVGRYLADWFLPLKEHLVTGTVINSHFTVMVKVGWIGSFFWCFGWFGGLLAFAWWVRKGGNALPLAMWTMFGVAGIFNPVLNSWTLWLLPVATAALFLMARPWRDWRGYVVALAIGAVAAVGVVGYYVGTGARDAKDRLAVRADADGRVTVNGENPKVWIVDDEETLGWYEAAREIRIYYAARPKSPALGYVRDLKLVPKSVRRIVLAGRRCREYVDLFKRGEAPRAREVIFISPPFGVNGVPFDLQTNCAFRMLVGEFAQRYVDVYGDDFSPAWVITVPGSELYVPGWVGYALSGL